MNDSKWAEVLDKVESQFEIEDQGVESLAEVPGGTMEFVVFNSPMGRMRLARETRPRVEQTKAIGGSKYGAGSMIEKVYSDTEVVHRFLAWKEVDGEWEAIDAESFI